MTGSKPLTMTELAEVDQHAAEFDRVEFHRGATEIRLSKSDGARWPKLKMRAFLDCLDRWSKRMSDDGYEILAEPEAGPGTMVWKAVKR